MNKNKLRRRAVQLVALGLTIAGLILSQNITTTILLAITLFGGAYYCGYICPFGFIQDLVSDLGSKLGIKKYKMPRQLDRVLSLSRYIIFGLVTFSSISIVSDLIGYEARSNFARLLTGNSISVISIFVILVFIVISLFYERAFCKYFCYTGAQHGILSLFRVFTIKRSEESCINCKKCDKVCPMNIEISTQIQLKSPKCINCFECVHVCPKEDTLTYGLKKFNKMKNVRKGIAIIVTLIILLLGAKMILPEPNEDSHGQSSARNSHAASSDELLAIDDTAAKDAALIDDGVYSGVGNGFKGDVNVDIEIKDGKIASVDVKSHNDDWFWFFRANSSVPDQIVNTQSTDVDLVSGATYSSVGIRDGVIDALNNASE